MSVIAHTHDWLPYVTPSYWSRPTQHISAIEGWRFDSPSLSARHPYLLASHSVLDKLATLAANWDSHGSVRPHPVAIERSRQLLEEVFRATATIGWQAPHISASEDGEVVFEWWNGSRKLTLYVGPQETTFLKSWGPHLVDDMADGVLGESWDPLLWTWLFD